ncbi:hypothetical protein PPERSA_11227 [Pseudocohnilembus persalinus]|uniref:Uncharacterized protein n=1 Tax=Pseudocohnilembus persalinus TaxID=266149 RepID=A0A0V0QZK7_PSEPJ|nr:hypothetical protein PPERSA_11227 [Pseudocohnilembus persalinus]|eukprot:KRX07678.1 hypothetical protein PPERSA_11227 [Pseudocohnilembus persalinus]
MIVQVNDEGGLWNRKPMIKHNNNVKKSHAFDAFKAPPNQKELNERYNYLYKNNSNYNNAEIQKANYERFYKMDGNQGDNGKSEYRQNYLNKEQDQFQQSKKQKPRPALPTPKYMQDLIQYKREHNVLNN